MVDLKKALSGQETLWLAFRFSWLGRFFVVVLEKVLHFVVDLKNVCGWAAYFVIGLQTFVVL